MRFGRHKGSGRDSVREGGSREKKASVSVSRTVQIGDDGLKVVFHESFIVIEKYSLFGANMIYVSQSEIEGFIQALFDSTEESESLKAARDAALSVMAGRKGN